MSKPARRPRRAAREPEQAPRVVYRYFDQREHALRLLDGNVWISTVDWCRTCDEARANPRDTTLRYDIGAIAADVEPHKSEQLAQVFRQIGFEVPPGVRLSAEEGAVLLHKPTDAYLFCTSLSRPNALLKRLFGRHCVQIIEPTTFRDAVGKELARLHGVDVRTSQGAVQYLGRDFGQVDPPPNVPTPFLGPQSNSGEAEYRFLFQTPPEIRLERREIHVPGVAPLCSMVD